VLANEIRQRALRPLAVMVVDVDRQRREVTHAARLMATGYWTSKLGGQDDIEHVNLACLEGAIYSTAVRFVRRRTAAQT
jgi:DNA-binding NarL/FixJ family response regulator